MGRNTEAFRAIRRRSAGESIESSREGSNVGTIDLEAVSPAVWRPRMKTKKFALLAVAVVLLFTTGISTYGQSSHVTFSAFERARVNAWQWFEVPHQSSTYSYTGSLLRVGMAQQVHHWDWRLELSQPAVLGLPSNAVSPIAAQGQLGLGGTYYAANGNNADPAAVFFKLGWVRYRFDRPDTDVRLGRFEFFDGEETHPKNPIIAWLQANRASNRLISNFGFTEGQRSFDGADAHIGAGAWDITALAARSDKGVFNMNGNAELNVDVQYLAFTRQAAKGHVLVRAFGIGYHDGRTGILKIDNRPLAVRQADHKNIRLGTYGGDLLAAIPAGPGDFDFMFWGVWQNGSWGEQRDSAGAAALEGGYKFTSVASEPWVRGGWFRSSGDNNPLDNKHSTFFQILTTPRLYARFPFYNLMNNTDTFVQVIDTPTKKLALRSDLHWVSLTSAKDLWYQGGGAFDNKVFGYVGRPSNGHTSLATVADISANWKATSHLGVDFYYAHATGKGVIKAIYPPGHNAQFGYVELDYRWKH